MPKNDHDDFDFETADPDWDALPEGLRALDGQVVRLRHDDGSLAPPTRMRVGPALARALAQERRERDNDDTPEAA